MLITTVRACYLKTTHWELFIVLSYGLYTIERMIGRFCRQLDDYSAYQPLSTAKANLQFKSAVGILSLKCLLFIYLLIESLSDANNSWITLQLTFMCCALGLMIGCLYVQISENSKNSVNFIA